MINQDKGIALVTGGATGIGASCCRALANAGFRIGIHYRSSEEKAKALIAEFANGFLIKSDLGTEEGVNQVYETVQSAGLPLEVLVNNAGLNIDAPIAFAKLKDFDQMVGMNMRGTWYLTKRLVRLMIPNAKGRIINITSVVGYTGNAYQGVYSMTKAAINNLTRTLAQELAEYGILVNAVAPGFIDTSMTHVIPPEVQEEILKKIPLKRIGKPEEIAEVVAFLATQATYITGTTIHVNGGMYGG